MAIGALARYWRHRLPDRPKIVMTLLVKNEIEIVEANVRTHAMLGVEAFAVMDNGSSDGTREKLSELADEFEIIVIDRPDQTYRQAQWMSELAFVARDRLKADWVISNDADEFWIPDEGKSLHGLLSGKKNPVLTVGRSNMILTEEALREGYRFFDARFRVENPVYYGNHVESDNANILLTKIAPKTIVNPHGLIRMKGGNHRALHVGNFADYTRPYDRIKHIEGLRVYHYPIRTYQGFEANIANRKKLLDTVPGVRMGNHYRRWAALYGEGKLREEFERFVANETDRSVLAKYGIVTEDSAPAQMIKKALGIVD